MKKLFYLTLISLSLVCLTACGSNDTKNDTNTQNSENELSWEEQEALENQKWETYWTDILADTWQPRSADTELGDVVIKKDGTCTIAGNTYTYKFDYVDEFNFNCYAYDGDTLKYSLSYTKPDPTSTEFEKHHEKLSVMVPEGENSFTTANGGGMFYRKSSYEAIAITAENWNTYFELVTIEKEVLNEFNELDRIYLESFYQIKEEYNDRVNTALSDVVFEVETKTCGYNYSLDITNKTYTLGERDNDREEIDTTTVEFREGHYSSFPEISYLSIWICSGCNLEADDDYCRYYLEEANVLRTTGTLYLLK